MPTYDYRCEACSHAFEEFQSMSAKHLKKCPECGKNKLVRLIGIGAGIIFKGSGFYETDYRSSSYNEAAKADKESSTSSETKSDSKADSKSDGKNDAGKADNSKTETKTQTKSDSSSSASGDKGTSSSSKSDKPAKASSDNASKKSTRDK